MDKKELKEKANEHYQRMHEELSKLKVNKMIMFKHYSNFIKETEKIAEILKEMHDL